MRVADTAGEDWKRRRASTIRAIRSGKEPLKIDIVCDPSGAFAALKSIRDPERFNRLLMESLQKAVDKLRELTPGAGRLKSGWQLQTEMGANGRIRQAIIENMARPPASGKDAQIDTATLLKFLEYGTKAHYIRPKKPGGILTFLFYGNATISARTIRTKLVVHPGTKAYGFLARTRAFLTDQLRRVRIDDILRRAREAGN